MTARRILILILILALLLACKVSGDPTPTGWQVTEASPLDGANATATYGAEEWHAQLTALAETPTP